GHQYIYNDNVNFIKSIQEKNFFGKPRFFIAEHLYYGPLRNDVGCLWDAGTHQLSVLQYLFNPGKITRVSGLSADISGHGFDGFTAATITFQNHLTANLLVSLYSPYKSRKFTIIGGNGSAFFDDCALGKKLELFKNALPKSHLLPQLLVSMFTKQLTYLLKMRTIRI
ncbi:MAG: hypothetical protein HYZ43_02380, partial [Flavobacteriia bacterium]|nr:hypothetical protein [Flavobacteriia bacterium]